MEAHIPENTAHDVFLAERLGLLDRLDSLDVFAMLRQSVRDAGGQRAWADRHQISPTYLNDVLSSRRDFGPSILAALGLRRVVTYEKIKPRLVE